MNAPTDRWEPYRVILDYEALQDGFLDRIDDLNTTLEQIDMNGGFAKGNTQKLLTKSDGKRSTRRKDCRFKSARRTFGWESLGKMLEGTGLALVLVVDDERFAATKEQLAQRKRPQKREMLSAGSIKLLKGRITPKISKKMQILRNQKLSPEQRRKIAKWAARQRWGKTKRKSAPDRNVAAVAPRAAKLDARSGNELQPA